MNKKEAEKTYAKAFLAYLGEENIEYSLGVANMLRASGINTDMNLMQRNITKQLEYVNSLNIKYTVIIGRNERAINKLRLRNMLSGEESVLTLDEVISKIKSD